MSKKIQTFIEEESDSDSILSMERFDQSDSESKNSEDYEPKKLFKQSEKKKIQISFENIVIKTNPKKRGFCSKKSSVEEKQKTILNDVSGTVCPGQFLAILGASGAGKTTLLNYLSGRQIGSSLNKSGQVYVNGVEIERVKGFSALSAYVQQDDILFQTLTVRECLEFAAKLKLSGSYEEKMYRVEEILKCLRLTKCQDTRIGGALVKGVSGGERKRTSIGVELITDPQLIFLDEPTTGLDSFTAQSVIETLKDLAVSGRTIISTIHQPNSQIFENFDRLMLLAQGKIIYFNEANLACDYFSSIGYRCPDTSNPADYFMTIMSVESQEQEYQNKKGKRKSRDEIYQDYTKRIEYFNKSYEESNLKNDYEFISPKVQELTQSDVYMNSAPWCTQLGLLIRRNIDNTLRIPQTSWAKVIGQLVTSILTIIIFQEFGEDLQGIQNRNGCLFFITICQTFAAIQSVILVFPDEKPVFLREVNNNMYSVSAYFIGKIIADIPNVLFFPSLSGTILYFSIGFNSSNFYNYPVFCKFINDILNINIVILLQLIFIAGGSYALIISSIFDDKQMALTLIPVLLIPFMLFAGFFVTQDNIPVWLVPFQYLSIFKYAFQMLMLVTLQYVQSNVQNEYSDLKLACMNIPEYQYGHCYPLGDFNSPQDLPTSIMFLIGLFVSAYIVSFVILKYLSRKYD